MEPPRGGKCQHLSAAPGLAQTVLIRGTKEEKWRTRERIILAVRRYPLFFVSVASKEVSVPVSPLE
jgi:hypothetical protein